MDRISLTRTDRVDTITRGAAAGSLAAILLAALEMAASAQAGHGLLWPWRMAASVLIGPGAFATHPGVAVFAGGIVHLSLAIACGITAAMLYEWSEWSLTHRASRTLACLAGAAFGAMVWFVNFPVIASPFFPWMWRLHQGTQLAFHLAYGVSLGLLLRALGRRSVHPPDSALTR